MPGATLMRQLMRKEQSLLQQAACPRRPSTRPTPTNGVGLDATDDALQLPHPLGSGDPAPASSVLRPGRARPAAPPSWLGRAIGGCSGGPDRRAKDGNHPLVMTNLFIYEEFASNAVRKRNFHCSLAPRKVGWTFAPSLCSYFATRPVRPALQSDQG